ncbi:hypothetical protein OK016_12240 [Vibrio chagasii]|nr:hypothetical protein [Vibrio chagasii]
MVLRHYLTLIKEDNPFLGWRGALRFAGSHPDIFIIQLHYPLLRDARLWPQQAFCYQIISGAQELDDALLLIEPMMKCKTITGTNASYWYHD